MDGRTDGRTDALIVGYFLGTYSVRKLAPLISILPKNHTGPVEKLISDFFRMPKKVGAIDS